jgi:inosose dehydratase
VDVAGHRDGHLRGNGYDGWYVLEQDTILTEEPTGRGPLDDVWASVEHLRSVLGDHGNDLVEERS